MSLTDDQAFEHQRAAAAVLKAYFRHPTDINFENLNHLIALPGAPEEVVLYEGLPHQGGQWEVFADEYASKPTVLLQGFPFYRELLPLREEHAAELTTLFTNLASFEPYSGPKRCSGYHPDYCIEWRFGASVVRAQICIGCHEMKAYAPGVEVYCDVRDEAYARFAAILWPYRKNRPILRIEDDADDD